MGQRDDDDQDPNVDDVDPGDDDQDGDDQDADWSPPKTKAEFDAMVAKMGNAEAAKWRRRATGKDPNWKPGGDKPESKPGGDGSEQGDKNRSPDEIKAAVRAELEAEYKAKAEQDNLRAEVSVSLMSAGLALPDDVADNPAEARKAVARVVRMMDLDNLVLEDGKVEGLDEEIAALRKLHPGLFKAGGGTKRTRGGDIAPKGGRAGGRTDDDDLGPIKEMARAVFRNA